MRRQAKKGRGKASVEAAPQMNIQFDGLTEAERLAFLKDELGTLLKMVKALKASGASSKSSPKKMEGSG
jgi:hypothetical protein